MRNVMADCLEDDREVTQNSTEQPVTLSLLWSRPSHIVIVTDFLILLCEIWIVSRMPGPWGSFRAGPAADLSLILLLVLLPLNAAFGIYSRLGFSLKELLTKSSAAGAIAIFIEAPLSSLWRETPLSDSAARIVLFLAASIIVRYLVVWSVRWYASDPYHVKYAIIVGRDSVMSALRERVLSKEQVCSQIVACFSTDPGNSATYAPGVCRYTGVSDLRRYLSHNPADIVILGAPLESIPDADLLMASVLEIGLTVCVLPGYCSDNLLEIFQFVQLSYGFAGTHLVAIRGVVQHPAYLLTKRMFDIVVSAIALLLLSPVFFAIAIMVKLTSRGPIFYHWKVLGKNRKPFVGYKFRTMCVDADRLKEGLMKFNEMTGPVFKMRSDPRITKIGCWLRKFSLDEIPQLYSVLMGDMSLVGPRPSFKSESDCFEFWQHRKLSVKPGITCLWQISGRNKIADFSDWAKLDLQYIENASFLLDLKILLMTIPAVLFAKGAC